MMDRSNSKISSEKSGEIFVAQNQSFFPDKKYFAEKKLKIFAEIRQLKFNNRIRTNWWKIICYQLTHYLF